ncbi:tyrosine-type recombinase/integrase [Miltoncostaea marina]|uniref:tyrosine-type recombinase/integrase n=1 Tax=Miltoncostaea marina TaxID=2843215 RepID=UPI001C3C4905|nr:tyrosine-type recombinase/integrase [Miltoncostaea marina]
MEASPPGDRTKGATAGRHWCRNPNRLAATLGGPHVAAAPLFPDLTAQTIRQAMRRACVAAGLRHINPHNLRHRFISRLVMAGLPITVIQRVVGHGRASVTLDVYSHVLLDEPAGSLEALRRGLLVVFQEGPPRENGPLSGPFVSGGYRDPRSGPSWLGELPANRQVGQREETEQTPRRGVPVVSGAG